MSDQGRIDLDALKIDRRQRRAGGGGRWLLLVLVLVVTAVTLGVIVAGRGSAVGVEVTTARAPERAGGRTILNASGYVTPRRRATVAAKITGRVTEVLVDEGMQVRKGQVLARLDDSDAQARYRAAAADRDVAEANLAELEVNLANAERNLRRVRRLAEDGVASETDLDDAQTAADGLEARLELARQQADAARAQLAVAEQDLDNYTIRAPFDGIAVSKDAQPGEMVSPVSAGGGFTRTGISTIVDMASLEIEVDVNESFIARVRPGQRVEANLDAYPEWKIPAHVRTVIPTADRQKATVKVRISFDQLDPRILPDMGVKVGFLEEDEAATGSTVRALVPTTAVRKEGETTVIFIFEGGVAHRRAVSAGRALGTETEVLAGVAPGELVVVGGPDDLEDGDRVSRLE